MFTCDKCNKSFKSQRALQGHQRVHSPSYKETQALHACRLAKYKQQKHEDRKTLYYENPNRCLNCKTIIPYDPSNGNNRKFCDHACAATYNNIKRGARSETTKEKIATTLKSRLAHQIKSEKISRKKILGPFSRIYSCTCAHCGSQFINRTQRKYCRDHSHLYKGNNRNQYAFTFSIGDYPDLFGHMSDQLREYGMWSPVNTNGLTRDHKISVNDAIKNNYDPFYIKHPLNCELMLWEDNNRKNTNSSLTFKELVEMVNVYESTRD